VGRPFLRRALRNRRPVRMAPRPGYRPPGAGGAVGPGGAREASQEHLRTAAGGFRDLGILSWQTRAERQLDAPPG